MKNIIITIIAFMVAVTAKANISSHEIDKLDIYLAELNNSTDNIKQHDNVSTNIIMNINNQRINKKHNKSSDNNSEDNHVKVYFNKLSNDIIDLLYLPFETIDFILLSTKQIIDIVLY